MIGVLLLLPDVGNAALEEYEIVVEFSYDTQAIPGKEVAGYRLYKDDSLLCQTGPVEPQKISCMVDRPGSFSYTLSAIYNDGFESPQSSPAKFTIFDLTLAIQGLQVLTGQLPSEIDGLGQIAGNGTVDLADVIHSLRQMGQ